MLPLPSRIIEGRFLPDPALPITPEAIQDLLVPLPARLIDALRLSEPATARDGALLWLILAAEAEIAATGKTIESSRSLPRATVALIYRRGGLRALRESFARLNLAHVDFAPDRVLAFAKSPTVNRAGDVEWRLDRRLLEWLRPSISKRKVEPFARIELRVALEARSRWTMPLYTHLCTAAVRLRPEASADGWIEYNCGKRDLASRLSWIGRHERMKDFAGQVLKPALRDLTGSAAKPRYLQIATESEATRSDRIILQLRRLGRTGAALDAVGVRERNRSWRTPVADSGQIPRVTLHDLVPPTKAAEADAPRSAIDWDTI
ncbi:hypothetical protein LCGC14_0308800 [marine sediment metagenome]